MLLTDIYKYEITKLTELAISKGAAKNVNKASFIPVAPAVYIDRILTAYDVAIKSVLKDTMRVQPVVLAYNSNTFTTMSSDPLQALVFHISGFNPLEIFATKGSRSREAREAVSGELTAIVQASPLLRNIFTRVVTNCAPPSQASVTFYTNCLRFYGDIVPEPPQGNSRGSFPDFGIARTSSFVPNNSPAVNTYGTDTLRDIFITVPDPLSIVAAVAEIPGVITKYLEERSSKLATDIDYVVNGVDNVVEESDKILFKSLNKVESKVGDVNDIIGMIGSRFNRH